MLGIAQAITQRDPITMTDPHVELSIVIKATLDILYDREVHSFSDDSLYQHVLEFARKWDMPIIIKTILKELRVHATSSKMDTTINSMFRLTLDIGDHDAIVSLVKACQGRVWTNRLDTSSGDSRFRSRRKLIFDQPSYNNETERYLKGSSFYESGSWPYSKFAALPPPIVWAILRAESTVESSHVGITSDSLPLALKKILRSMCESKGLLCFDRM